MKKFNKAGGFTLIELLVVIGIIAILAAIVIVSINPAKRFQDARNSQRQANVESILNAMQQAIVDNKGIIPDECGIDPDEDLTDEPIVDTGGVDLAEAGCLDAYLAVLPYDPIDAETYFWTANDDYDTGYELDYDSATGQITISAPKSTEDGMETEISVTR